jgi:hypothetical protein
VAGKQRDAVALQVAAVGSARNTELQEQHCPDVVTDLTFDVGFPANALARQAGGGQARRRAGRSVGCRGGDTAATAS